MARSRFFSIGRIVVAFLLFWAVVFPASIFAGDETSAVKAPWLKGERLTYSLGWGIITAGSATLEVRPTADGKMEFLTHAYDSGALKKIYPVSDTVYTLVRGNDLVTDVFYKSLHEGSFHNKSIIRFDRSNKKAALADTVFSDPVKRQVKKSSDTTISIKGDEHSIMSAFYFVRSIPLASGDTTRFSAVSGTKRYELKVIVHGREKMKYKGKTYNTVKIEPVLDGDGIFNSKGRIFIWLTDDDRRIPLLMECEVALGSVKARLISDK